ncbi:MAG: substrate-binding domain-containing protein [Actinobacteria bacterium]|nr:substrate-binding domain-containing protein [Actinomycetota bacterium]
MRHSAPAQGRLKAPSHLARLLAALLTAAACASPGGAGGLAGSIVISGSSTVEPISIAVAEKFHERHPVVDISVDGPGTGDGFELFCDGEIHISNASRPIRPAEIADCEDNDIQFIELKIAIDGIAVLTSPNNNAIGECLSFADLYSVVGPESRRFDRWSDANSLAAELGETHAAPFPDVALDVTGPGEESGTYDSFVEIVIEEIAAERGQPEQTRPDYQASADDNVVVQGVTGTDTSLGWVGYAFFKSNKSQLKAFEIVNEDGACVAATPSSLADGSYPISRPLFIYVHAEKVEDNEALSEFVDFYLSDEGIASVTEVGYVVLTPGELEATKDAWEARETGARDT